MSVRAGDPGTVLGDAPGRRWYQLEDRHLALARGRALAVGALLAAAVAAPLDLDANDRLLAVGACLLALALHALLVWIPARRPRRLLSAVDAGLVVDAALIGALAGLAGGREAAPVWLLPLSCLAVTMALGVFPGLKALVLSALVVGALTAADDGSFAALVDAAGPLALAAGVVAVAAALGPVNERELTRRRERMATLHAASLAFLDARDEATLRGIGEDAAQRLMPGWEVEVELDALPSSERRWREGGNAVLELPVAARHTELGVARPLGVIRAARPLPRVGRATVRADAIIACRTLATALASALVQRELVERLEHLSLSDPLTGLGNRRAFDQALGEEAARARRARGSMGLMMIDVDHFKQFNDRHGHQAGDDALVEVGRVLAAAARTEDRACRIGGEEFALLLPGADAAMTAAAAERVRAAIEDGAAADAPVTVSVGVAASGGDDPKDLLALADARLYVAKAAGRNRVIAT